MPANSDLAIVQKIRRQARSYRSRCGGSRNRKTLEFPCPWVHRLMSDTKIVVRGARRGVSNKRLESDPNEICYRFNRRFWERELFDS